ncbi:MAG: protein kinase [Gemmatales bacterium]|nr:protein kinase [Gemmatales bacterium]MDW8387669.1 protein kinase [Gemmatales bacterium]
MFEGKQIGTFKIEKELGSGAMGTVYRAMDERTGQYVAIKFVAPGLAENDRIYQRFEREAKVLQQLKHPNIVRRIGTGKYHKTPFFIMEYVDGKTLAQLLEERGRLPWDEVIEIGKQIASALYHAHSFGIIHRDLKPSNLMITRDGKIKLTDFGIAKDLDAEALTSVGCTVGTAAYMSPEQCQGVRDLTHKSDLYSLGVVLYELLTGRKPYYAENVMDMFMLHVKGTFERPSRFVLDIPVWLDTLVCQLLEKDPDKRPEDAHMVEVALEEVRQKVEAQRSVGLAVAGKVALRPKTSEDRRAAETLLESRKRKRKKGRPDWKSRLQTALTAGGLGLALLAVVVVIVIAVQPDTPEQEFRKAERLVNEGMKLLDSDNPDAANVPWYDAERQLEKILAKPNHPFAAQAQEQLELMKAGGDYLNLLRALRNKSDWGQVATDDESGKRFLETCDRLMRNYPPDHPIVVKAREKLQPLHAPYLFSEAERLTGQTGGDRPAFNYPADWKKAFDMLRLLQERYPTSEQARRIPQTFDWLVAWQAAEEVLVREATTGVPRVPSLLAAERDAIDALAVERRDYAAAQPLWRELAERPVQREEERPWIRLAQQMLKRPPPKSADAENRPDAP